MPLPHPAIASFAMARVSPILRRDFLPWAAPALLRRRGPPESPASINASTSPPASLILCFTPHPPTPRSATSPKAPTATTKPTEAGTPAPASARPTDKTCCRPCRPKCEAHFALGALSVGQKNHGEPRLTEAPLAVVVCLA